MKYFLYVFIALFSIQSYAAASRDEYLLQRQIQAVEHQNKVYGIRAVVSRESVPISGTTQTEVRELIKRSIAVDTPTPTKVGSSMLKRIYSPQAIVGTAAVTGLLAAIDWVMKDGSYVKLKPIDDPPGPYVYKAMHANTLHNSPGAACSAFVTWMKTVANIDLQYQGTTSNLGDGHVYCTYPGPSYSINYEILPNENYDPNKPPQFEEIPLTPVVLGALMLGSGYSDPVDPSFDSQVNTGSYTGVKEVYEHDPNGVGNEVADDMDDKLDNASPTPDNKPSSIPDPAYDNGTLSPDSDTADRSWTEKGDQATGSIEPTKDPVTGEATGEQSIALQFPLFCSWASKMCLWYDDWKESDKIHQKFEEDVKNHQSDEKSFWQTVKDWFDWTKEEPEPEENQQPEPDDQGIFTRTFDTTFSLSNQCPPDIPINFESTYLTGSYTFSMNWLCIIFSFMGYPLVFLSHCIGIWILYETVTQKEIKW